MAQTKFSRHGVPDKPRPHQQQCRSNVRLCCQKRQQCRTSFALKFRHFDKVERCFDIVASVGRDIDGAATLKARRARSVLVRGTTFCGASYDCSAGARVCTRSLRYVGVAVARTLWAVSAILYVTGCLTGSQWSDLSSGPAPARPPRWQMTLARLF